MRRYKNYYAALLYLQAIYKKPGETRSVYDALERSTLYRWFTSIGVLREKHKQCVQNETSFTKAVNMRLFLSKRNNMQLANPSMELPYTL
jgi:hypothetical protein